jgi:hypothetical protein
MISRKIVLLVCCIFFFSSCAQSPKENAKQMNDYYDQITDEIKFPKPTPFYTLQFNIPVPSEIRINNIVISKNYLSGVAGPEIINQYIEKSGIQKVSVKIQHPYILEGGLFNNDALKSLMKKSFIQTVDPKNDYVVKVIKDLKFPIIKDKFPSFEYGWTFDATVPYSITSWDDAQILKNVEKDKLIADVLEKYHQLWNILQSGNVDEFMQEINDANNDLFVSNYFDENKKGNI